MVIRRAIKDLEDDIGYYKEEIASIPTRSDIIANQLEEIRVAKIQLNIYRNALSKYKGFNSSNISKVIPIANKEGDLPLYGYCKCGCIVMGYDNYCGHCGNRIVWKEVKFNGQNKKKYKKQH